MRGHVNLPRRLWLLALVPNMRFGRWLAGLTAFVLIAGVLAGVGAFVDEGGKFIGFVPLFFCVIVAYIIPVFHFITAHTEQAFDDLAPMLDLDAEKRAALRHSIGHKSWRWVGINLTFSVALWMLQSWLLAGAGVMGSAYTSGLQQAVRATAPLLVWVSMTCVVHALIDNANLFRRLGRRVRIDVYDTRSLTPFGSMAVRSILAVVGAQASFSIMWLADTTNLWTTIPGMVPITIALLYLFFAPVWPLHRAIREAKQHEVAKLQQSINHTTGQDRENYAQLLPLLAMRREVMSTNEWPVDLGLLTRLSLYLVIVPLTWIGAALIENVVDVFVS